MKMKETSPEVTANWGKIKKKEDKMAKKLIYGLNKKYQKETGKLLELSVVYDEVEDELMLGVASRKDVKDPELLLRIEQHIAKCLRYIANGGDPTDTTEDVEGYLANENEIHIKIKTAKKGK